MAEWDAEKRDREQRLEAGRQFAKGKMVAPGDATKLLEAIIRPGDRVCVEGDNQKQADFLAGALAKADKGKVHDLHIVQSGIVLKRAPRPLREGSCDPARLFVLRPAE